jgi:hypothetical protein
MKKLLLLFIVLSMASCIAPYHTKHQARTIRNISRPHHYRERPVSPRHRGDYNHPAVRKQTRKSLQQNGN